MWQEVWREAWDDSEQKLQQVCEGLREVHETSDKLKTPAQWMRLQGLRANALKLGEERIALVAARSARRRTA